MLMLISGTTLYAQGEIKYDFDEVKVLYAAEFNVFPIEPSKVQSKTVTDAVYDNVTKSVYGVERKPIKILYGVVSLNNNGQGFTEEFIKVSDGTYFARGLSNTGS